MTEPVEKPWRSPPNRAGHFALILGVAGIVLMFVPIVGEFLSIPAAIGAVVAGIVGFDRFDRGLATGRGDAVIGGSLGVLVLLISLVLLAAVHGIGSE